MSFSTNQIWQISKKYFKHQDLNSMKLNFIESTHLVSKETAEEKNLMSVKEKVDRSFDNLPISTDNFCTIFIRYI